jgi:hypothetical protein
MGAANNHACAIALFDSRNPGRREEEEEIDSLDLNSPKRETKSFEQRQDNPQSEEERIAYVDKLSLHKRQLPILYHVHVM